MWNERPIELALRSRLASDKLVAGEQLYARYVLAREKLISEILPWIRKEEPSLTDHGPEHVANVLNNVDELLGISGAVCDASGRLAGLTSMELYILCMASLFHDVGNLFGRTRHNEKIAQVYGAVFNGLLDQKDEKAAVVRASRAHTGTNSTGGKDTLKELGGTSCYVYQKPINLLTIGAVVRFADELAEGPQRTSAYLLNEGLFEDSSKIYHEYASITDVVIDRGGERIALTYRIDLAHCKDTAQVVAEIERVRKLLELIYGRVIKLDQERRYARHYCDLLSPFKLTTVVIEFWADGWQIETGLAPIQLSDLVVPGDIVKPVVERDKSYSVDSVLQLVRQQLEGKHE